MTDWRKVKPTFDYGPRFASEGSVACGYCDWSEDWRSMERISMDDAAALLRAHLIAEHSSSGVSTEEGK